MFARRAPPRVRLNRHVARRVAALPFPFSHLPADLLLPIIASDEDEHFFGRLQEGSVSKEELLLHVNRARALAQPCERSARAGVNFVGYGPWSTEAVIDTIFRAYEGATATDFGALVVALFGKGNVTITQMPSRHYRLFDKRDYYIDLSSIEFPDCLVTLRFMARPWLDEPYFEKEKASVEEYFGHNVSSLALSDKELKMLNDPSLIRRTQFDARFLRSKTLRAPFDVVHELLDTQRYYVASGEFLELTKMPRIDTSYNALTEADSGRSGAPEQLEQAKTTMNNEAWDNYCKSVHEEDTRRCIVDRNFNKLNIDKSDDCSLSRTTTHGWHLDQTAKWRQDWSLAGNIMDAVTDDEDKWVKVIHGLLSMYSYPSDESHFYPGYYQRACTKLIMQSGMLRATQTKTDVTVRDTCS
jgi:hypothetical protein